jgi:diguanylate cyclase (GGDEF)-like protein
MRRLLGRLQQMITEMGDSPASRIGSEKRRLVHRSSPAVDTLKTPISLSPEGKRGSRIRFSRSEVSAVVFILFILVIQRIGFELLGTGSTGIAFNDALSIFATLVATGCCFAASRRGRVLSRIFWLLFACASVLEMFGNVGWAYYHFFPAALPAHALFPSMFYRLAAAPMAMILFLSAEVSRSKLSSFLENLMVVGLVAVTTYQVQMAEISPHDPKIWQVIGTGTAVNGILALAAVIRYSLSGPGSLRGLFGRQAVFLSIYLAISFSTSFVDAYLQNIDAPFDLIWILPSLVTVALAVTWRPPAAEEKTQGQRISRRASLLCFNLTLVTMVLGSAILGLRLADSTHLIGLIAVSVVLFSFAVRSALMQDTQEKYLSALQESRTELQRQALYDELTGLPNRRLFAERLIQVLAIAERDEHRSALFYLDLDGFKPVNDKFGHLIGDILLKRVAQRMLSRGRKSDTLARMGGDEFTWLVSHISNKDQAAQLAEEMLRTVSEPYEIEGLTISITASIGICLFPDNATEPAALIQQADSAMYSVKRAGKNGFR